MEKPKKHRKRMRRFYSEKSARLFAKKVNGEFKDLRGFSPRKSDFKVTYEKQGNIRSGYGYNEIWNKMNNDGSFAYNGASKDF